MVATVASEEPQTEAKPPQATIVADANPARRWARNALDASYKSFAIPTREIILPIKTNRGRMDRAVSFGISKNRPVNILMDAFQLKSIKLVKSSPLRWAKPITPTKAVAMATGMPKNIRVNNIINATKLTITICLFY